MDIQLNLLGPCNESLGYGVAFSNIVKELATKCHVNLYPIGGKFQDLSQDTAELFNKLHQNSFNANKNIPSLKVWHQHQLFENISRPYFAWPIFELDTFTDYEVANLKWPDELIVCSKWAKNIIENHLESKVTVIPLGVNSNIFKPQPIQHNKYRFINIGKIEIRKGHDILLECFNKAFDINDDVELHMAWDNIFLPPEQTQAWVNFYKNSRLSSKIFFHSRKKSHSEISDLINSADCGIFPSRAEGWNLELLECMACGLPVITTNYSAHTEFCNTDNAFLVDIEHSEKAVDNIWFHGQGNWAYIGEQQKEQIIEHMRYCYNNRPSNPNGLATATSLTWENVANNVYRTIFKRV